VRRFLTFMVRRVGAGLFTIWAIVTLAFFVFWAIPQEPAQFVYPTAQHLTPYMVKHGNHLLGTDRSILTQYGDYLWQLLHGDFGKQWSGAQLVENKSLLRIPIGPEIGSWLPVTLSIVLGGAVLVVLLSVPLGAIAGRRIGAISDRTISLVALIGICTHPMVIGLILRGIFGEHFHWAPVGGYCTLTGAPSGQGPATGPVDPFSGRQGFAGGGCGGIADWTSHLVLPWLTFALLFLALYTRMIRASVAETLPEDYVRTARAKGAGELRVMTRHVLPNATIRVLTMVGMEVGTAIGVCAYIETAYGMNGLGREAIFAMIGGGNGGGGLDLPVILAIVTVITLIVVIGNLVVDALYAVVDPRVRFGTQETRTKSLAGGVI
jgi:peptide/nickel transport system permease protein